MNRFMDLSQAEVTYFIEQVAGSAMSFGVSADDLTPVGTALMTLFGYRCSPPTTVIPAQGSQGQSICQAEDCPLAPMGNCDGYTYMEPSVAVSSLVPSATASATGTASVTPTASGTTPVATGAAASVGMSFAAVVGGFVALVL